MTISTEPFVFVNTGSSANDGTGDSLRAAFVKVNENFANIQDVGFDAGNIYVSGTIEAAGNITADGNIVASAYFVGDGQFLSNVVGTYDNVDVAAYLPTYSGNIANLTVTGTLSGTLTQLLVNGNSTFTGTVTKKAVDESNVYTSSQTLDFNVGGTELLYLTVNSNIAIGYGATIVAGRQVDLTIQNPGGFGTLYATLPNANTNKSSGNISIAPNSWARLLFTAFGATDANVVVAVTNS
jgi:hypothetical protein